MPETIGPFAGEYRWLSNFWPADVRFGGFVFPTVEHAYQAAKTTDPAVWRFIASLPSAGQAKRGGRGLAMRPDWDSVKLSLMVWLVRQKFQNGVGAITLRQKMRCTNGRSLVEYNYWHDNYWGICQCQRCMAIADAKNHLGHILTSVRDDLLDNPMTDLTLGLAEKWPEYNLRGLS